MPHAPAPAFSRALALLARNQRLLLACFVVCAAVAAVELWMGRLPKKHRAARPDT